MIQDIWSLVGGNHGQWHYRVKMHCRVCACVSPQVPLQRWSSSCPVLPGWRGVMAGRASGSLHSCWVSIALFHKQSDLYFDSTHVFFSETPVSISDYPLHPSLHCIAVVFSTICWKELICQMDKIFKDVKEEARQHRFRPTGFVGWQPGARQPWRTLQGRFV